MVTAPDRYRCCACSLVYAEVPQPAREVRDDGTPGRVIGFTRAAPPCPRCGSLYAEWLTWEGSVS